MNANATDSHGPAATLHPENSRHGIHPDGRGAHSQRGVVHRDHVAQEDAVAGLLVNGSHERHDFLGEERALLCFAEEALCASHAFTPGQTDLLCPAVDLLLGDQGMLPLESGLVDCRVHDLDVLLKFLDGFVDHLAVVAIGLKVGLVLIRALP